MPNRQELTDRYGDYWDPNIRVKKGLDMEYLIKRCFSQKNTRGYADLAAFLEQNPAQLREITTKGVPVIVHLVNIRLGHAVDGIFDQKKNGLYMRCNFADIPYFTFINDNPYFTRALQNFIQNSGCVKNVMNKYPRFFEKALSIVPTERRYNIFKKHGFRLGSTSDISTISSCSVRLAAAIMGDYSDTKDIVPTCLKLVHDETDLFHIFRLIEPSKLTLDANAKRSIFLTLLICISRGYSVEESQRIYHLFRITKNDCPPRGQWSLYLGGLFERKDAIAFLATNGFSFTFEDLTTSNWSGFLGPQRLVLELFSMSYCAPLPGTDGSNDAAVKEIRKLSFKRIVGYYLLRRQFENWTREEKAKYVDGQNDRGFLALFNMFRLLPNETLLLIFRFTYPYWLAL